jgi:hemoglobin
LSGPKPTPYELIGGDAAVRELVRSFYDLMDSDPTYAGIRKLHKPDLSQAREKLYLFLSGWLGGPQLYAQRFGHPALRARHLPFAIGEAERDLWLACMSRVMEDIGIDESLRRGLGDAFFKTADWMRNRDRET